MTAYKALKTLKMEFQINLRPNYYLFYQFVSVADENAKFVECKHQLLHFLHMDLTSFKTELWDIISIKLQCIYICFEEL